MRGVVVLIGRFTSSATGPARKGFLVGGPDGSVSVGPVVASGLVTSTIGVDSGDTGARRKACVVGDAGSFSSLNSDSSELERLLVGRGLFTPDGAAVRVGGVSDWLGVTGSFDWRSVT